MRQPHDLESFHDTIFLILPKCLHKTFNTPRNMQEVWNFDSIKIENDFGVAIDATIRGHRAAAPACAHHLGRGYPTRNHEVF